MWPYILLVLTIFILQFEFNNRNKENFRFYIGITVLFLFAALRGVSNGDYIGYLLRGKEVNSVYKIFHNNTHMEIGYSILYYFVNLFHLPEQSIIMIMNFISIFCTGKFIERYSPNKCLSLLIFLPLYFQFDMQAARTAVAISISVMGIDYVIRRHFLHFCFTVFLAMLFHRSAIVVFPIYFLVNLRIDLFVGIMGIVGGMGYVTFIGIDRSILQILRMLGLNSFYVRYYGYVNSREFGYRFSLIDPRLLLCIFIYIAAKIICKKSTKIENFFINCSLVNVLIMIFFSEHTIFCCRLSAFYYVYFIVLIPMMLKRIFTSNLKICKNTAMKVCKELHLIITTFFMLYGVAYAYVCFISLGLKYKLFF